MEPATSVSLGQGIIGQNYYSEYIFSYAIRVHSNVFDIMNKQIKNRTMRRFVSSNNNPGRFCLNKYINVKYRTQGLTVSRSEKTPCDSYHMMITYYQYHRLYTKVYI